MKQTALDLTHAIVITPPTASRREQKAVQMLLEEAEKRCALRWSLNPSSPPAKNRPVIFVASRRTAGDIPAPASHGFSLPKAKDAPEGYTLAPLAARPGGCPGVAVVGNDERGVLFGVGRLLRLLDFRPGRVLWTMPATLVTAPQFPLRGHQLGYRPKTNSYDGWDLQQWQQYFRDLAIFGANAIELIPPRSDDDADSPHFPLPPMEMNAGMSRVADEYGLDVWVWYPALDKDYGDPATVDFALREWGEFFAAMPRLDAVLVPGGDPGETPARELMALLEKQTKNLHRHHPRAQMWISPQGFDRPNFGQFLKILEKEPAWLAGVTFGPWIHMPLEKFRRLVPSRYPIRYYPDITHTRRCQYPVPDWDWALAATHGREPINPRPIDQARICRLLTPHTIGALTYSEGCNDDVNKALWSGLLWQLDTPVFEILRDYARCFVGCDHTDEFALGLLALEENWRGPLLPHHGVTTTLLQFQAMEDRARPAVLQNWRFQQALFRAYFDAHVRRRLIHETALEESAMDRLRQAGQLGSLTAMEEAARILDQSVLQTVGETWRIRLAELAEALFQSVRMQLRVRFARAIAMERGASYDSLDYPLNNRLWLKDQFEQIRQCASEADRLEKIAALVNWTNPGPGGFYDDLGDPSNQPHVVSGPGFDHDPAFLESAMVAFPSMDYVLPTRTSWQRSIWALDDASVRVRYDNLDPAAGYRVRVVYAEIEPKSRKKVRLLANDRDEIHPLIEKPIPVRPLEFPVPRKSYADGQLDLVWYREAGLGGAGRGCQVSEVWLIRSEGPGSPRRKAGS